MRFSERCFTCLMSRVEYECRLSSDDEDLINDVVDACAARLASMQALPVASPVIASAVHRLACELLDDPDPYHDLKEINNGDALRVCRMVEDELDTFQDFCLASVIANTLDYGAKEHTVTDDFVRFFHEEFAKGLTIDQTDEIADLAARVVYLTDNCGEIVFDRLLIRYLKEQGSHVTVAVRGAPILNDATMEDALAFGIDRIADYLTTTTTGIAELGFNPDLIPGDLGAAIDRSTLIISKGMANYESFTEYTGLPPVACLMSVKCEPIGKSIPAPVGSRIAVLLGDS